MYAISHRVQPYLEISYDVWHRGVVLKEGSATPLKMGSICH